MVAVGLAYDQSRNGAVLARHGRALILDKQYLGDADGLVNAVQAVIRNER